MTGAQPQIASHIRHVGCRARYADAHARRGANAPLAGHRAAFTDMQCHERRPFRYQRAQLRVSLFSPHEVKQPVFHVQRIERAGGVSGENVCLPRRQSRLIEWPGRTRERAAHHRGTGLADGAHSFDRPRLHSPASAPTTADASGPLRPGPSRRQPGPETLREHGLVLRTKPNSLRGDRCQAASVREHTRRNLGAGDACRRQTAELGAQIIAPATMLGGNGIHLRVWAFAMTDANSRRLPPRDGLTPSVADRCTPFRVLAPTFAALPAALDAPLRSAIRCQRRQAGKVRNPNEFAPDRLSLSSGGWHAGPARCYDARSPARLGIWPCFISGSTRAVMLKAAPQPAPADAGPPVTGPRRLPSPSARFIEYNSVLCPAPPQPSRHPPLCAASPVGARDTERLGAS